MSRSVAILNEPLSITMTLLPEKARQGARACANQLAGAARLTWKVISGWYV